MVESSHVSGFWPSVYEPFRQLGETVSGWFAPASEAGADKAGYKIELELPGVKKQDIDISLHDHVLTVKGEKRSTREEKTGSVFFCERRYGAFQRTFRLPADARGESVLADFTDGVLTLTIPRVEPEQPKARRIEIAGG